MTDVIDDSLSWEQRRELRRKKRQELLADAERLVQKPDTSASSQISQNDEDDSFEQERARRRKDREEKRRKERDEIEKQLKDEEEARSERERRREERRRQREEEGDSYVSQTYKSTSITKTELTTHDGDEDVVETTTTTEVNEYVTNGDGEYSTQNGEEAIENGDAEEEEERYEEEQEEEIVEEDEDTNMKTSSYTTSITVVSTKKVERHESSSSSESEAEEQEEEEQIEVIEEKPAPKSRSELIAERRKKREMEQLEEEKRKNEEAEKLKAEQEERRAAERAEREKRMAEGEAKRKELRKQISQDVEPLTAKGNTSSPLIMKMKDLNSKISDSPKVSKQQNDTNIAKMSSLDDRLKSYTSRAQKQDSVKRSNVTPTTNTGVASRLNMWESGKVSGGSEKKKAVDTAVVKQGAGVSSRKNLWETGRVGTASAEKKSARADVHGADFSSRKNLWLKATQESAKASPGGKSGETQGLKTGVMSRLNKWEKGEVSHSTASIKQKSDLPASDVVNRRHKWENIAHDSPKETSKTKAVRPLVTTEVSSRKNLYESKAEASAQPKPVERKPRKEIVKEVVKEPESEEEQEEEEYVPQTKRKESVDSYSDESDERVLSDTDSEDQGKDYGRPATSGTDESDQDE